MRSDDRLALLGGDLREVQSARDLARRVVYASTCSVRNPRRRLPRFWCPHTRRPRHPSRARPLRGWPEHLRPTCGTRLPRPGHHQGRRSRGRKGHRSGKGFGGRARVLPPHEEDSTSDLESRIESHLPCLVAARGRRTKARLDRRVCIGRYRRCLVRPGSRHAPTDAAPAMSPHQ
jgi:hypothetical protein